MTLHGTIRSGVVVLEGGAALPEGTPVTVLVEQNQAETPPAQGERMTEEELRRRRAALDEILSLPNENPGDTFSGRDHDKVLYGEPLRPSWTQTLTLALSQWERELSGLTPTTRRQARRLPHVRQGVGPSNYQIAHG